MAHVVANQPTVGDRQALAALEGLTVRAAVLAALLVVATYLGITRLGFIRINWVPYVVPPVPALLFLVLLYGLNLLFGSIVGRLGWKRVRPLSRGELFLVYAALCICLSMDRGAYILHYLMVGDYYGTEVNRWKELFEHYPEFYIPHDEAVIRGFFESTPSGRPLWRIWARPLAWWSLVNITIVWTVTCLVALFRKQWVEGERLTFPMLFLPLAVTGGVGRDPVLRRFFVDPVMWIGFALAALFNGINILHAFSPSVPSLGWYRPIVNPLSEGFLRFFRPMYIHFNLELLGLSYLISGEVLLSGWSSYFFVKFVKAIGYSLGYRGAGFPHFQELSAGACIAMALFMVWVARGHLAAVWRNAAGIGGEDDANEALPYRWLLIGFFGGAGLLVYLMAIAGLSPVFMTLYLASLSVYILVAARIRAEAGPPTQWTHPWGIDQHTPIHLIGTRATLEALGRKGMVLYYALFWIGRTIFAHSAAQYSIDSLRLADHGRLRRRSMLAVLMLGAVVGMMLAWWYHLDVGYRYGQAMIGSAAGRIGRAWAFNWSRGQYMLLRRAMDAPRGPLPAQVIAYIVGFAFCWALIAARMRISNFPFHPLGFILGTLYGEVTPYWFPFVVAWAGQRTALRYGGFSLYRRLVPAFLGLAFGHIMIAGILWRIIINYFIDPVIAVRYYINLGG